MNHQMDNERRFVIALEHWLESNMAGGQEYTTLAMDLIRAILAGRPCEGTPFEWLATILKELCAGFCSLALEEEMDALVETEGARVAAALEEILSGGIGLGLVQGFLEGFSSPGRPAASPAPALGSLDDSLNNLDDLDSLFQTEAEDDFQSIVADMLRENRPGVETPFPAAATWSAQAEMHMEPWAIQDTPPQTPPDTPEDVPPVLAPAPDTFPSPDMPASTAANAAADTPAEAPADEPFDDSDLRAAAAQTVIENVLELVRIAPHPAEPGQPSDASASERAPEEAADTATERAPEPVLHETPQATPAASEAPAAPPAVPVVMPYDPTSTLDSRQIATALASQIRTLIVNLEHAPEDQQNSALRLIEYISEIDRRIRRMGYRLFSSLCDAVLAILETVRDARLPLPFDVIEKLGEFSQCIDNILFGQVSRNKSYYSLIKDLNETHDLLKARLDEARELKQLELLARGDAVEARPDNAAGDATAGGNGPAGGEGHAGKLTNIQEVFLEEAGENIDALTRNLLLIEKNPSDQEIIYTLMRAAHSIKGSAAIARFPGISSLAHAMEDLLVVFRDESLGMTGDAINLLLAGVDRLQLLCTAAERGEEYEQEPLDKLIEVLKAAAARTLENKEQLRAGAVVEPAPPVAELVRSAPAPVEKAEVRYVRVDISQLDSLMNLAADLVINRTRLLAQTERQQIMLQSFAEYRRRLKLLGTRLTALLGAARAGAEPALAPAGAESFVGTLTRHAHFQVGSSFSRSGQQLLRDFSAGEFDRFNELDLLARDLRDTAAMFDDLGENMSLISAGMEQNLSQVSHVANDLHQSIMKTRMVPIGQIFSRFPRVVRDLAAELGKQINLHMDGEDTLLDKNIIEEITNPLIHIIRNAVDHGLETVAERERLDKEPAGNIWLSARLTGNQALIEIRDDGRGIDTARLRQTAVSRDFLSEEEVAACTEADLIGLLLLPGFSTAAEVTDLSGRGVGLDVVNQAIKQLRGSLHISSEFNEGTTISIRLPITLAINQALLFKAGGETFAIPLSSVDELIALPEARILQTVGQTVLMLRGQIFPLFRLDDLIGLKDDGVADSQRQIMLISDGVNRGALIVDTLIGREEIVIKSLGSHLRKVRYFSGCTILGDGVVTLIVDPSHILQSGNAAANPTPARQGGLEFVQAEPGESTAEPQARQAEKKRKAAPAAKTPGQKPGPRGGDRKRRILVTDDSISIRRFVSGILESAGYEVELACDGVDALKKLEEATFDLLLTDLEMPRMHGYELITEVRSSGRYPNLPIIILTSRMGDKHSRKGLELGASAFMVKPFDQMQLLATVNSFVAAQEV